MWGGPDMPVYIQQNLRRWQDLHPEWTFVLWRDIDLDWLEHRDLYDAAPELVPADAIWQFRSDLARYEILAKHGGLYVDCDTHPLRPFDAALAPWSAWAAWEDQRFVGNSVLYANPDHQVMRELVAGLRESIDRGVLQRFRPNRLSGPRYLTPIWLAGGWFVALRRLVYPYSYADVKAGTVPVAFGPDVLCVHQWHHTRQMLEARRVSPSRHPARSG
jgi:hypothetical protein